MGRPTWGGGADLCIGAGERWLANMNERACERRDCHIASHIAECSLQPEANIVSLGHECECDGPCKVEGHITEEQRANANLISAAPDMRDAIEATLDPIGYCKRTGQDPHEPDWLQKKLLAAALKAELGEPRVENTRRERR